MLKSNEFENKIIKVEYKKVVGQRNKSFFKFREQGSQRNVMLTSSISLSSDSPFSHMLRCTQLITFEYSFPLLGKLR